MYVCIYVPLSLYIYIYKHTGSCVALQPAALNRRLVMGQFGQKAMVKLEQLPILFLNAPNDTAIYPIAVF